MQKFELTTEGINFDGRALHRIKALVDFGDVGTGDLGGWIEKEENLSHDGLAWVCGGAKVYDNADYATAKGFGSVYRTTPFFRLKNGGVGVKCGCFYGTLAEFREKVRDTYPKDNTGNIFITSYRDSEPLKPCVSGVFLCAQKSRNRPLNALLLIL